MSYWGPGPDQNDFGTGSIGVVALLMRRQLDKDVATVMKDRGHPEQSIIAMLTLLRSLGEVYPAELSIHFRRKQFEAAKTAFHTWYSKQSHRIPEPHREGVLRSAECEFQLWEERIFTE